MADIVLLVFEGEKTEPQIFNNLKQTIFGANSKSIIHATYNAEIYQLWEYVRKNPFMDLLEVLRDRNARNRECLAGIERDQVSRVFLFFDYDGHATGATDEKIQQMLAHFNEETENGKLYVSYPMVEAFKDTSPDFKNHVVPAKENIKYKTVVAASSAYKDPRKIIPADWRNIISKSLKKGSFIVTQNDNESATPPLQDALFEGQLINYIQPLNQVAVLSGIPFFLVEYFGGLPPSLKK